MRGLVATVWQQPNHRTEVASLPIEKRCGGITRKLLFRLYRTGRETCFIAGFIPCSRPTCMQKPHPNTVLVRLLCHIDCDHSDALLTTP